MITVRLIGGLGNQMFQYATGRSLAIRHTTSLALDISDYDHQTDGMTKRHYSLDCFQINGRPVKVSKLRRQLHKFGRRYYKEPHFQFAPTILSVPNGAYLEGYWQTENYFQMVANQIRQDFTLQPSMNHIPNDLANTIQQTMAVSVHIRRGDYITNQAASQFHGLCDLEYYRRAAQYITEHVSNPHWFIFSDDITWVKDNLSLPGQVTYVSNGKIKDYEELTLMSYCRHHIIANSSFSWWGAWLNSKTDKIVVGPTQWFANRAVNTNDVLPPDWVKL